MNKHILILGNNKGLPGVKIDCENYRSFFKSGKGGYWYDSEITIKENATKIWLSNFLTTQKSHNLDYFITIFSGHGGTIRDKTSLELSPNNDVLETVFNNIAYRQLSIFDCCRCCLITEEHVKASKIIENRAFSANNQIERVREKYDRKIMSAIGQHAKLYACKIGEAAQDTSAGGAYTCSLLKSANNIKYTEYKTVGQVHQSAIEDVKKCGYAQNPDALLPRCYSTQELIFTINPNQ